MTARKVRAEYDALDEIAKSFDREAENTRQTLACLHRDLDVLLDGDWVGKGATEFYHEMISDVLPGVKRLANALEQAACATNQISRIMQQAENDAAALFRVRDDGSRERTSGRDEVGLKAEGSLVNELASSGALPFIAVLLAAYVGGRVAWEFATLVIPGMDSQSRDQIGGQIVSSLAQTICRPVGQAFDRSGSCQRYPAPRKRRF